MIRHIISILIENESGALSRVAGLFSARGYNIESLTVAPTEDASLSRMTLVTRGSEEIIEQITKQLNKLIDVVKLIDLAESNHIERELLLIKVKTSPEMREEIRSLSDIFRGKIIDVTPTTYIIEMTGPSEKLDAFVAAIDPDSIIETVRSGPTGISRGEKGLHL
jgi:acetolactate synthase I/III small subunit